MRILANKEVKNAGWLIGGKIAQMLLSLIVSIFSARLLGPSNYGLVNYGLTYTAFFTSLCYLGLHSIVLKEFVDNPNQKGLVIGTSLGLRLISSLCAVVLIFLMSVIIDHGEKETIIVVVLTSISLIFQTFDTFSYFFQANYMSRITAIAGFVGYTVTSCYRILLLIMGTNVRWFALSNSVDYIFIAVILFICYKKHGGPKLSFSFSKGKELLGKSYHFILSGAMIAIYGQADKLMLKHYLSQSAVGLYSVASSINNAWVFVLSAIVTSLSPSIMSLYKTNKMLFERKNKQLYCLVFYISTVVAIVFTVLSRFIVSLLYGEQYIESAGVLAIITWLTAFSYLGVARDPWSVCTDNQKFLKYMYVGAAVLNVILNAFMIPRWGINGAALASLLTQFFTCFIIPLFIRDMRPNVKLMFEAIIFKGVF